MGRGCWEEREEVRLVGVRVASHCVVRYGIVSYRVVSCWLELHIDSSFIRYIV